MADISLAMDATTKLIVTVVQVVAGATMLIAIWISYKTLQLQRTETMKQNARIIELLEKVEANTRKP